VYRKLTDLFDLSECSNGSQAFPNCVQKLNIKAFPDIANGDNFPNGTINWALWTFTPMVNGYALLGELDKIVNVSPKRFDSLAFSGSDNVAITFGVSGAIGEVVHVWFLKDGQTVVLNINIPESEHIVVSVPK